jgi:CheY-like chemotaxis protein
LNGTVLIVEDDRDVLESMAEVLEDCDYQVLRAVHGAEALERLRHAPERPCVILLDIMMPVMDAWQFRAVQASDPDLARIPVIILSAHAKMQQAAIDMHADGALAKPVRLDVLLEAVARFCPPHGDAPQA